MTLFDADRRTRERQRGVARNAQRLHHPDFDRMQLRGWRAAQAEKDIPGDAWERERLWALKMGLPGADSINDKSIPTFARGELPHYAGINTFLKAPYAENVRDVAKYDAAVLGIPFDSGTTYPPAPASAHKACGGSRPSTRPTITRWASTCASR